MRPGTATVTRMSDSCPFGTVLPVSCLVSDITTGSVSTSEVVERDANFLGLDFAEVEATEVADVDIKVFVLL